MWLPDRNRTPDYPNTNVDVDLDVGEYRAGALSTELRELMRSEAILRSSYGLHTVRIGNIDAIMNCDNHNSL